jgi:hypothetical protein
LPRHLSQEFLEKGHFFLQEIPFDFSFGNDLSKIGLFLAPKATHHILVDGLVVLMKEPVFFVRLMPVVLDFVLALYVAGIEFSEDEFDFPFDWVMKRVRTPI